MTHNVTAYSVTGNRVTFKLRETTNKQLTKEELTTQAITRLRSMGIPEKLVKIEKVA